jgi:hypothetical protein
MRGARFPLAALLAAGLCAGCATGRSVPAPGFAHLSTESIQRTRTLEQVPVARGVEVRVMTHVFLWVPTRPSAATLEEAVDQALRHGGGDVLVNASVRRVAWYVPPFYGREGWVVRGDVVRLREPAPTPEPALDADGPEPWRRPAAADAPAAPEP